MSYFVFIFLVSVDIKVVIVDWEFMLYMLLVYEIFLLRGWIMISIGLVVITFLGTDTLVFFSLVLLHWGRGSPIYLGHMVTIFGLL